MADNIGNKAAHDYHLDVPAAQEGFYVKGSAHCSWGMKNRLARMFRPQSGNTVMLAFDHGYIMGPTAGLERIDLVIPPLVPYVDVLMGTRGVIRSCVSPAAQAAKSWCRASGSLPPAWVRVCKLGSSISIMPARRSI